MSTDRPPSLTFYNPHTLRKDDLVALFTARRGLLDRLIAELRDESGNPQHHLLVGPRGMGKTTLLQRLRYAIEDDPQLSRRWTPLVFPEEQYNVGRISDFWLNCVDALAQTLVDQGHGREADALDAAVDSLPHDEEQRAAKALALLDEWCRRNQRGLVLLLDNADIVFDRLRSEHWAIREVLSSHTNLVFIGASAAMMESTYRYDAAFYDFFRVEELRGLSENDAREMMLHLASLRRAPRVTKLIEDDPGRFPALHTLTGGNPRTLVILYSVLEQERDGDIYDDLEGLLDQCTPLYKARFEALPEQAQRIVDAMAVRWHPVTAADIAAHVGLDVNIVSTQMHRLVQQGTVEKVGDFPDSRTGFQLAERFFNIWYLMRASRRVRRRLQWLVEFLKLLFGTSEIQRRAASLVRTPAPDDQIARTRMAELAFAFAEAISEPPMRRALETRAVDLLVHEGAEMTRHIARLLDLRGEDAHIQPIVNLKETLRRLRQRIITNKVGAEDCPPSEVADLIVSSPWLTARYKAGLAEKFDNGNAGEFITVARRLRETRHDLIRKFGSEEPLKQLEMAVRSGTISSIYELEEVEAAAIRFGAPWMVDFAIGVEIGRTTYRSDIGVKLKSLEALGEEVLGRSSPSLSIAWYVAAKEQFSASAQLRDIWRQMVDRLGNEARFWQTLAEESLEKGWFHESEYAIRRALEIDGSNATSWLQLAHVLFSDPDRFVEADNALDRCLALEPKNAGALWLRGSLYTVHGRFEEAQSAFDSVESTERLGARNAGMSNIIGAIRSTKPDPALEKRLRATVRRQPDNMLGWLFLVLYLAACGDRVDEAHAILKKESTRHPKLAELYLLIGLLVDKRRTESKSHEGLEHAIATTAPPMLRLAAIQLYRHGSPLASRLIAAAAQRMPDDVRLRQLFATSMAREGNWQAALAEERNVLGNEAYRARSESWPDIVAFFTAAVATHQAADAAALLVDMDLDERWRPLHEALVAAAQGSKESLRRLAPEIRVPAEILYDDFVGDQKEGATQMPESSGRKRQNSEKKPVRSSQRRSAMVSTARRGRRG